MNGMGLGDMITVLEQINPSMPMLVGSLHSYRGYYKDLAFGGTCEPAYTTVGEVLEACKAAEGKTFTGWKGGDFIMDEYTDLWQSPEGTSSGMRVIAVQVTPAGASLVCHEEVW